MKVRGIRGAIIVEKNEKETIFQCARELLEAMISRNSIDKEDICSIIFTVTPDLNAAYPAAVTREMKWDQMAMLCLVEMSVPEKPETCQKLLRILMHVNTNKDIGSIKHVYLKGAIILRPDLLKGNIAIDGPAGAGKSTVAKMLAEKLGYQYIDTGAMYRAITWKALKEGIDLSCGKALGELAARTKISFDNKDFFYRIFCDGENVTKAIRTPKVSSKVSLVARVPEVRKVLQEKQRELGKSNRVVMDGRDITTVVLPDAPYKFYLNASLEERTRRRFLEFDKENFKGDMNEIKQDIMDRDRIDSEREMSPLQKASDAYEIDTTGLTPQEVFYKIIHKLE